MTKPKIGTIGHVDHGKTTLLAAILRTQCDHCHGTGRVMGIHEHLPSGRAVDGYYIDCPACDGSGKRR